MVYGNRTRYDKICPICDKKYTVPFWQLQSNKTCSHECSKIYKSRLIVPEYRKIKAGLALKGKYTKEKSSQWKGDNASYASIHEWVRKNFPIPKHCQDCSLEKPLDAANVSGNYTRQESDWRFLCRKCHLKFDGKDSSYFRRIGALSKKS